MLGNASSDFCSSSVRVEVRPVLLWAPVTAAALSGVCVALVIAALLCACHRKRLLDIRTLCTGVCHRLQDQTVGVSESAAAPPADGDEPPRMLSSDVAAFALKARVVYPINQRHRPLADGASNPSLHELHKRQTLPSLDSASSLTDDWLSQERGDEDDDDDDSSQFMSSKTHTSHMFRRVQHYAQTPCHSRVSLLSLTLQELRIHTAHLQQQKYKMFLRALCVLLSGTENTELLQQQQQEEVESLLRGVSVDVGVEPHTVMCSVEEEEQTGREQLQRSMQTAVSFAQQLQRLLQDLQRSGVCEELQRGVLVCVRTVEDALAELQESVLQMLLDRFLCWQEVSDSLKERTALLKQEAELMLKAAGQSVESLGADGQQSVCVLEAAVREALEKCTNEVVSQTEDLALNLCQKVCVKRRRMMKAQSAECNSVCNEHTDARHMLKVCVELQAGHWLQRAEFEQQQDFRIIQTLCECWMSLFSECSRLVADLCTEFVLRSITADPAPSTDPAPSADPILITDPAQSAGPASSADPLLKRMKSTVANQMQREERHAHTHLRTLREQLQRHRQVWQEGGALSLWRLLQFGDQQRRLFSTAAAQHSVALLEDQQHLLILELQRVLSVRCFYLRSLREMKLTAQSDTQDSSVTVETVRSEEAVIGQNPLDEQLSELEAAADVLRGNAHFLLGHALCCTVRGESGGVWRDRRAQERLLDAVCASVYVSRDSVASLIRQYYSELQKRSVCVRSAAGDTDAQKQRAARAKALQTQITHWARKPRSPELQHRVVELKRVCVSEIQKGHHHRPEHTHPYTQLRELEQVFVRRLASLARVSLDDDDDDEEMSW